MIYAKETEICLLKKCQFSLFLLCYSYEKFQMKIKSMKNQPEAKKKMHIYPQVFFTLLACKIERKFLPANLLPHRVLASAFLWANKQCSGLSMHRNRIQPNILEVILDDIKFLNYYCIYIYVHVSTNKIYIPIQNYRIDWCDNNKPIFNTLC